MAEPVCVISGVGPGTGTALVRRFASEGYRIALEVPIERRRIDLHERSHRRRPRRCGSAPTEPPFPVPPMPLWNLPATDPTHHRHKPLPTAPERRDRPAARPCVPAVNTMGLLYLARRLAPTMVTAGQGAIIVTGNTSAQRGRANFAGFAPTKAAQRILAEAMARDLGPKGVHVAYIVIDAVIDVPWARERFKTKPDDFFIAPAAIADEAWHVANQPRLAWSFNVEVRPYGETW